MKTRTRMAWFAVLAATVAWPVTAQVPPHRPGQGMGRRAELQQRIHERFMGEVGERLGLDEAAAERLSAVMREMMEARMELAQDGQRVRQHLLVAAQDPGTSTDELARLLNELAELRSREFQLAEREDATLAEFLTPRQRAQLLVLRARFNQRVQEIRARGMGPPGPGMMRPPGLDGIP